MLFFFFKQNTAYEMRISDWSSDVCSSDLVPWAMVFPTGGPEPRHPSQLYQALMEGVLLFLLLNLVRWNTRAMAKPGIISGVFLIGYGAARIVGDRKSVV